MLKQTEYFWPRAVFKGPAAHKWQRVKGTWSRTQVLLCLRSVKVQHATFGCLLSVLRGKAICFHTSPGSVCRPGTQIISWLPCLWAGACVCLGGAPVSPFCIPTKRNYASVVIRGCLRWANRPSVQRALPQPRSEG